MQLYKGMACHNKFMIKKRNNIPWNGENRKAQIILGQLTGGSLS
jgi:hypothetical protein